MHLCRRSVLVFFSAVATCVASLIAVSAAFGQEDCNDYYFGISGAPDFTKALKCYEKQNSWEFLILMHLNGEGTRADIQKADELFRAWQKTAPNEVRSMQAQALRKAIEERKRDPKKVYARLNYCGDIAADTPSINFCGGVEDRIAEREFKTIVAATRARLAAADRTIFDKIVTEFGAFKEVERRRVYQKYIDGTIRNIAALGQVSLVREHFVKLMGETIERRGLRPADKKAYKAADDELNRIYRDDIQDYTKSYEGLLKDDNFKNYWDTYKRYMDDYKRYSREAQIHWVRYRDLLAELARSLYKDKTGTLDPAVSMSTAVTKIRVVELRNDGSGKPR